jgi:hypothetical protein
MNDRTATRGFFPNVMVRNMKYTAYLNLGTVTSGSTFLTVFRLNSIFDPDKTNTGHQPYFYDTASLIYNKYVVLSCNWRVCVPSTSQVLEYCVAAVNGSFPALSGSADFQTMSEYPCAEIKPCSGVPSVLSGRIDNWVLTGKTKAKYLSDDVYAALFSASPAEGMELGIMTFNVDASSATHRISVELNYKVQCYDPILQSASFKDGFGILRERIAVIDQRKSSKGVLDEVEPMLPPVSLEASELTELKRERKKLRDEIVMLEEFKYNNDPVFKQQVDDKLIEEKNEELEEFEREWSKYEMLYFMDPNSGRKSDAFIELMRMDYDRAVKIKYLDCPLKYKLKSVDPKTLEEKFRKNHPTTTWVVKE